MAERVGSTSMMKTPIFVAAVLMAIAGAMMPASAQMMGRGGMGRGGMPGRGGGSIVPHDSHLKPISRHAANPEGLAEDLRMAGKCDRAVGILRGLVNSPYDPPVSEYNLGLCLIDLASANTDKAQAKSQRQEGAGWVLRAANSGFNLAEAKAPTLYLDGIGVSVDPVEAQKWALIYHSNPMRFTLGLPDIAPAIRDRLDAVLSDPQRAQAQARADAWSPKVRSFDQ
jgi:hypothetical protein